MSLKYYKDVLGCELFRLRRFVAGDKDSKKPRDQWGKGRPGVSLEECEEWTNQGNGVAARPGRGLIVVDVDVAAAHQPHKKGQESWPRLVERFNIPPTLIVEGPTGGSHHYFKVPEEDRSVVHTLPDYPDVEFVHTTRLITTCGSPHYKGGRYTAAGVGTIAELPQELLKLITMEPIRQLSTTNGSAAGFEQWRASALAAFPLDMVYKIAAGADSSGDWIQVHDTLNSETGDRRPSAGVATGRGEAPRGSFKSFVSGGKALSLFDYLIEANYATDFLSAAKFVEDVTGIPLPRSKPPKPPTDDFSAIDETDGRYRIDAALETRDQKRETVKGLAAAGDVYVFKNQLSQVSRFEGRPAIRGMSKDHLLSKLTDCCNFYKRTKSGDVPVDPPDKVVRMVRDDWTLWAPIQELRSVVTGPQLLPDGDVVFEKGVSKKAGLLLDWPSDVNYPELPTGDAIDEAAAEIISLVTDFPFLDESHRAAWLAMLLTIVCRSALPRDASSPLFFIDSSARGAGKSLVATIASVIATGSAPSSSPWPENNEECQKVLCALAIEPTPLVFFDNVANNKPFGHAALDSVITSGRYRGRVLGKSAQVDGEILSTFVATGNGLTLNKGSDIERRLAVIRLECDTENPEDRVEFAHGNEAELLAKVVDNWPRYYVGCLAICKRVIDRPPSPTADKLKPWGSFSAWGDLIRRAVMGCGLPDPAGCREYVRSLDDKKRERTLLFSALKDIGLLSKVGETFSSREIWLALQGDNRDDVRDILERLGGRQGNEASRYGRALSIFVGGVSAGLKLRQTVSSGRKAYFLEEVKK